MTTTNNSVVCPYCGTTPHRDVHTRRTICECRRLHECTRFDGKTYTVLYKKDGTKEIRK